MYVLGPNELSIVDVELIPYIFGPQGLPKGPSKMNLYVNTIFTYLVSLLVWDGRHLLTSQSSDPSKYSLLGVRDLRRHAQLRKPWNNAFHSAALRDYKDMLRDRAAQFMTHLQKLCEDKVCVDLANLIDFFSFVFLLSYFYHTHYIVTVSILWVISRNCLIFRSLWLKIDFFTLDSGVYIP